MSKEIALRVIGAGVGFAVVKLAALGVTLSVEAQTALTLAIYGVAHRLLDKLVE